MVVIQLYFQDLGNGLCYVVGYASFADSTGPLQVWQVPPEERILSSPCQGAHALRGNALRALLYEERSSQGRYMLGEL